jgi:hypothetical protein
MKVSSGASVTVGAYGTLLLLGAVEGMIGSFQYSLAPPAAAIAFCAGILVTCLLAAWGMQSISGAFAPALGWIVTTFVLSMPVSNGSVIIASSSAGKWYLYGGTVSVVAAMIIAFGGRIRTQVPGRR